MKIGEGTQNYLGKPIADVSIDKKSAVMLTLGSKLSLEQAKIVSQYNSWDKNFNSIWE